MLLTQLETRICGTTYSTGWESDEDETEGRNGNEDGGDDNDEAGVSGSRESKADGKPNQVLVTVGSQAGEQEQLLVLDADWCVGDIFIEIVSYLVHVGIVAIFGVAVEHSLTIQATSYIGAILEDVLQLCQDLHLSADPY